MRVAELLQQAEHGNQLAGPDGLSPEEQLQRLARELHAFVTSQYECWNQKLVPALVREGIRILPVANLDRERVFGEILQSYLKDTRKARILRPDGTYTRTYLNGATKSDNGNRFSALDFFIARAEGRSTTTIWVGIHCSRQRSKTTSDCFRRYC